jgi:hypothetical protein
MIHLARNAAHRADPPAGGPPAGLGPGPPGPPLPETLRADLVDWRFATAQVIPYVPPSLRAGWQRLRASFFADAATSFDQMLVSGPPHWSIQWGRGLCHAVEGHWPAATERFSEAAQDAATHHSIVAGPAADGLVAGASLLSAMTRVAAGGDGVVGAVEVAHLRSPYCAELMALLAIVRDDPELLGRALLLAPHLADDLDPAGLAGPATRRARDFALARTVRLHRALLRLGEVAAAMGLPAGTVEPLRPGGDPPSLTGEVDRSRLLRPAVAALTAQITVAAEAFLNDVTVARAAEVVGEARDAVAYANKALFQTDHPIAIRPIGIPPPRSAASR